MEFFEWLEREYGARFVERYQKDELMDDVYDRVFDEWERYLILNKTFFND